MLTVKLNNFGTIPKNSNPFQGKINIPNPQNTVNTSFAAFTANNLQANFAPFITFKGFHERAVIGVETKIRGISQEDFHKSAISLQWRHKHRNERGEQEKIQLRMEVEKDNKGHEGIALYHDYKNKSHKLGYLPEYLAKEVKPLIDKKFDFCANVVDVIGGSLDRFSNVGVRVRLEYLSKPERSPNERNIKKVKKAFRSAIKAAKAEAKDKKYNVPAVMNLREEIIIHSHNYDAATKLKIDTERLANCNKKQIPVYRKGWKQLDIEITDETIVKNRRAHSQDGKFKDNAKQAAEYIKKNILTKKEDK